MGMDSGFEDTGMVSEHEAILDYVGMGHDLALVLANGGEMSGSAKLEAVNGVMVIDGEVLVGPKDSEPLSGAPGCSFPECCEECWRQGRQGLWEEGFGLGLA